MDRVTRAACALAAVAALAACDRTPAAMDAGSGAGPGGGDGGSYYSPMARPQVLATIPAQGATGVSIDTVVAFRRSMDSSVEVTLTPPIAMGAPSVGDGNTVTFKPARPLDYDTRYLVRASGHAPSSGHSIGGELIFDGGWFTTEARPDVTPPFVVGTEPAGNATGVATDAGVSISFSHPMNLSTVTVSTDPAFDFGSAEWSVDRKTLSFPAPPALLASATAYALTLAGSSRDIGPYLGSRLDGGTTFSFTTIAPADTAPPIVAGSAPAGTGVMPSAHVSFTFSEPMNRASVEAAFSSVPAIAGTWSWTPTDIQADLVPSSALNLDTEFALTLSAGAKDKANNPLAPYTSSFTTAAAPDVAPPAVVSTMPGENAAGVPRHAAITVTFSEAMNKASSEAAFLISSPAGFSGGTFSWDPEGRAMTYSVPSGASFAYGAYVSFQVLASATDLAGNALTAPLSRTFRAIRQDTATILARYGQWHMDSTGHFAVVFDGAAFYTRAGDDSGNNYYRTFISFDLSSLPSTLTLIKPGTTVNLKSYLTWGNPYGAAALGELWAQSVDFGPGLDAADRDTPVLQTQRPVFTCSPPPCHFGFQLQNEEVRLSSDLQVGWLQAEVARKVSDDWAHRTTRGNRSQFRIRFTRDFTDNRTDDYTLFSRSAYLSVSYEYP